MAYDEELAERVRELLADREGSSERKLFGGLGFFAFGNLAAGLWGRDHLVVRVGPAEFETAMHEPHTGPFAPGGTPFTGWVEVAPEGLEADWQLREWVEWGWRFASSLPPK